MAEKSQPFPCELDGHCPYEYDQNTDRDIEGMPLLNNDPRGCPKYGHVCPMFMEECGLTAEGLNIRATVHCFQVMGRLTMDEQKKVAFLLLFEKYRAILQRYPESDYPQYYDRM
ncbi:MAG: hypothetical protein AB1772_08025 [Candidatus Zixiibacteriota bacterium]